jgi:tetratricopeptide (TPR) repeat protein
VQDLLGNSETEDALQVLEVLKHTVAAHFGDRHPVYAATLNNLGLAHKQLMNWDAAVECYADAVRIYREVLGAKHINTTVAIENHANACKSKAESVKGMERLMLLENARELLSEVLATKRLTLGERNVQVGMTMMSLGSVLRLLGGKGASEASALVAQGSEMVRAVMPANHATVATAYNNLGLDLKRAGHFERAEEAYAKALEIRTETLGPDHPDTIVVLNNQAELYLAQGQAEKAAELQQRILAIVGFEEDEEEVAAAKAEWIKNPKPPHRRQP